MVSCPSCGKDNPEGFAFCGFCTAPLTAQATTTAEERKVVSVLFCDLVGFTSASESADPEEVRARLVPYHARVRDEIESFGGVVEKFVGDAVMAVFGAPITHEDDPERAVRAGLRVLEAIEDMNAQDPSLGLSVRIAVNTGEALVALGARPELGEAMVAGDVVNTASRLQGAAPVDSIVVGRATHRATERVFVWEELPAVELKGKAEPTPLWRAVEARGRFGVDILRAPTTPFVGRDDDLALLSQLYGRAVKERSVQLVTIVGEPGVGKSRLVAELGNVLDARPELVTWRQGRCLPYGDGISFWALGEVVKAHAGILDSDEVGVAKDKLLATLVPLAEDDRPWMAQHLAPLLGADSMISAQREETFTAWRRFLESIAAEGPAVVVIEDLHWADAPMVEFLEHVAAWSEGVPLLVLATARPEFYERYENWGAGMRNALTISLSPLTDAETAHLVGELLDTVVLPAQTQSEILSRAGGNPLYAEEFVRMLTDRGLLVRDGRTLTLAEDADIPVPDTIQALIAARIDTLDTDRKALLHDASVIGKVFWSGALAAMGRREEQDVAQTLHELASKELVRRARSSSIAGQDECAFWHALVRDVAYGQIPRSARADKHLAAARWISDAAGDRPKDVADILVHHYDAALALGADEAVLREPLGRALGLAGARARRTDVQRACRLLGRAVELAADDEDRAKHLNELGMALASIGSYEEAKERLQHGLDCARASGSVVEEGLGILSLETLKAQTDGYQVGPAMTARATAIELLESAPPSAELAWAYWVMANEMWVLGRSVEGLPWTDKGLSMLDAIDGAEPDELLRLRGKLLLLQSVIRLTLGDGTGASGAEDAVRLLRSVGMIQAPDLASLGEALWPSSGPTVALDTMRDGVVLADRMGDSHAEIWARMSTMGPLFDIGLWDEAGAVQQEIFADRSARPGLLATAITSGISSVLACCRGDLEGGRVLAEEATQAAAERFDEPQVRSLTLSASIVSAAAAGSRHLSSQSLDALSGLADTRGDWYYVWRLPMLVRICVELQELDRAHELLEGVQPVPLGHEHVLVTCHATLAEAAGSFEEAAALYADAEQRWAAFPSVLERGHALFGLGRCSRALGRPDAESFLIEARSVFASLGAEPSVAAVDRIIAPGVAQLS